MAEQTRNQPSEASVHFETNPLSTIARQLTEENVFTGGPMMLFESVGRDALITMLQHGLRPDHKLLDFGCGPFRLGYWLIRFLDAGNYYGIDPKRVGVEAGKEKVIGKRLWTAKKPTISFTDDCDMGVFGVRFDYVVTRSVLTHASPGMLRKMLATFGASSTPQAKMVASYFPAKGEHASAQPGEIGDRLPAEDWRFLGVVKYSFDAMREFAEEAGLHVCEHASEPINGQIWLTFEKSGG